MKVVEEIPTALDHLSYQIATRLQIPLTDKQQLIETLSVHQLLDREIELLERENRRLKISLLARRSFEKHDTNISPWKNALPQLTGDAFYRRSRNRGQRCNANSLQIALLKHLAL